MRLNLLYFIVIFGFLAGCTDSESEELIEGRWYGRTIVEDAENKPHELPEGIFFDFDYPNYVFEGDSNEQGNYYIKDEKLHLIPEAQEEKRAISILQLSSDTLTLKLVDSLGSRSVLFLRN
ncbi:MAG TPA: hypothetical protein VKZ54_02890 [Membranihabitans sp.]|nr:hypothetical protein [Membranihabitans sp.]